MQLKIFQRTAAVDLPDAEPALLGGDQGSARALARSLNSSATASGSWYLEHTFGSRGGRTMLAAPPADRMPCRWNLRLSVRDPELRRRLTPEYQAMCKRQVLAGHYYQACRSRRRARHRGDRPRRAARASSPPTACLHELDLLVLATGFDAHAYVRPDGDHRRGRPDARRGLGRRPDAYRSVAVPGFPNLFMLMGPHSPVGNQSLVIVAENQADYAMWWINQIRDGRVAPRRRPQRPPRTTTRA